MVWPFDFFDILFYFASRRHYFMSATETFHFEIRAYPKCLPFVAATRVLFFHSEDVTDSYIHTSVSGL